MQQHKVSIFIPFRDTVHFLPECLDSILVQSHRNWEVLAVDDHSGDQSADLLESYAKRDSRIRVFPNGGRGIIPALRTAYAQGTGAFVSRMDSDDIMKGNRMEAMLGSLVEHGPGHLAVGQVQYFSHRGISDGYRRYQQWLNRLTSKGDNFKEIYKECVIPSPCWMAHRSDFEACGGFGPDRYPEDYDLAFRFYEKRLKVIPSNEVLHLWRDYDSRTSRTHVHYAQNHFLELKLHYFLLLDRDVGRPLVLWGAGFKGKFLAAGLQKRGVDFYWICDNPRKIGKKIHGKELLHFGALEGLDRPQSVVTVANETSQREIRAHFEALGQRPVEDYFFFC